MLKALIILKQSRHQLLAFFLIALLVSQSAQAASLEESLHQLGTPMVTPRGDMLLLDGRVISMADLRGKVVLVNFWATWCPPCVEELPTIQQAWDHFPRRDFEVLAVALDNETATVTRFLSKFTPKLKFPIVFDGTLEQYRLWNVGGVPTTYIVDRDGNIRYLAVGARNYASRPILKNLSDLMAE